MSDIILRDFASNGSTEPLDDILLGFDRCDFDLATLNHVIKTIIEYLPNNLSDLDDVEFKNNGDSTATITINGDDTNFDINRVPWGVTSGDTLAYNATTKKWEVKPELVFDDSIIGSGTAGDPYRVDMAWLKNNLLDMDDC